jgi:hypothetical protein
MWERLNRMRRGFGAGVVLGILVTSLVTGGLGRNVVAQPNFPASNSLSDNPELSHLYDEDQADRKPGEGKPIDWTVVGPRDHVRESRVKDLYKSGALRTGKDYHRAAMVLQHARQPDDYLLAHEFCVAALAKGEREARWLAAATEDRFLMNIGRPQRFGTQYRSSGNEPVRLYEVSPEVTDSLRAELGVPPLAEARKRETSMNELVRGKKAAPKP